MRRTIGALLTVGALVLTALSSAGCMLDRQGLSLPNANCELVSSIVAFTDDHVRTYDLSAYCFDNDAGVGGNYTIHGNFFPPNQSDNAQEFIRDAWGNEVDVWGTCNVDPWTSPAGTQACLNNFYVLLSTPNPLGPFTPDQILANPALLAPGFDGVVPADQGVITSILNSTHTLLSAWMLSDDQHASLRESEKQVEDNWYAEHGGQITKSPNLPNLLATPTPAPLNLVHDPGELCPPVAPNLIKSVIVQPLANQHYTTSVPIKVELGTIACAKPVFNLRFQVYVPSAGTWQDAPVLAQVDMAAHPQGTSLPASAFAPYTQKGTLKQWRVMAQLAGSTAHPWTDWTSFTLN